MDAMALPMNRACPIARSLESLGQKWNLLILREALLGRTRFGEFERIGVPASTLGARLDRLVDDGLLERRSYREAGERARDEYVLTEAGRDAIKILAAIAEWGGEHRPAVDGPTISLAARDGRPLRLGFVDEEGRAVDLDEVTVVRHPS